MLTGPMADLFKGATGHSDEAVARLHPGLEKFFRNIHKLLPWQTIAEVVKADHCFAQVKVGDKLVFDPFLNTAKSTGVLCSKALLPVLMEINAIWEMSGEWAESGKEEPAEIVFRNVRCLDPGFENGGIGGVVYRIHSEKKA
jgi:hypothetical protein